jgi:hypothetical protein
MDGLKVMGSAIQGVNLIHLQTKDAAQDVRLDSLEKNVADQQVCRTSALRHNITRLNRLSMRGSTWLFVASTTHVFVALEDRNHHDMSIGGPL